MRLSFPDNFKVLLGLNTISMDNDDDLVCHVATLTNIRDRIKTNTSKMTENLLMRNGTS